MDLATEDMEAVLDASGSRHCAVVATTSLGPAALLLAATRPDRVSSLVLYGTYARMRHAPDHPIGLPDGVLEDFVKFSTAAWGTGAMMQLIAPSRAKDATEVERFARLEKLVISPSQSAILGRVGVESDVRHVLSSVQTPTLVIHRTGDRMVGVDHGRHLAEHIPSARMLELEGEDHAYYAGEIEPILNEIEQFVTGDRKQVSAARVLKTVLFTDIVDSTRTATEMGDQRWRNLLDHHDRIVLVASLDRFQGRLVNTTGDGLVATFDSPARGVLCAAA